MKQKFSFPFPKSRGNRRPGGQLLAAAALMLSLAAVGTASVSLSASRPQALAVQPVAYTYKTSQKEADAWRPEELVPAREPQTCQPEVPAAEAEPEAPAEAAEETPAPAEPLPEDGLPAQEPEEIPAAAALTPSNPALDAEDKEDQVRLAALESTNGRDPLLALGEEPEAAPPEADAPAAAEGPDGEVVLLTPEMLEEQMGWEAAVEPEEENCLAWLLEVFFGIGRSGWHSSFGSKYYYDPQTHERVTGVRVIDGKLYCFNANGALQDVTFGIDVSKYQQSVNWAKVKEAGVEFVIIRIGYRGYETGTMVLDPMYEAHMAGATAAGLRTGVYFFSQAINEAEAIEEAEAILYVLDVLGHSVQYPIYFDSEYATSSHKGRADGLTSAQRTACAVAFCERIQQAGYRAGVYASTNWFKSNLDYATVSRYSIWNAHYGVAESAIACDIWQGTGTGTLDGVAGQVDINVSYIG